EDYERIVKGGIYQVLSPEVLPPITPRINVREPSKSLLLLKPTMAVAHGGGERFKPGSADYDTILRWVLQGAPYGPEVLPTLRGIECKPREILLELGQTRQLQVTASFADGRREDITAEVRYESLNPEVATIRPTGQIDGKGVGETGVILRWLGQHDDVRVGVSAAVAKVYTEPPRTNFIDDCIFDKLRRFRIQPS